MPTFDAVAWLEARDPWVYRGFRSGRAHDFVAKPVSAEAMLTAQLEIADAKPVQLRRIVRRVLRLAFPWRWSLWITGDPVKQIEALPLGGWEAVVRSFFEAAGERPAKTTEMDRFPPISSSPTAQPGAASPSPPTP